MSGRFIIFVLIVRGRVFTVVGRMVAAFAGVGAVATTMLAAAAAEFFLFFFEATFFFFIFGVSVDEVAGCYELKATQNNHF